MPSPEHPKSPADLVGWTPFQIVPQPDNIYVHWIQLGDLHFADPFFGQTVERRLQDPARQVVTTPITALAEVAGLAQSLPPGAFVFHCARAGSTLLANAFRVLPGNLVLAEPQPINQLMGAPHRHQPEGPWPAWLRDLLACLGQPRRPGERRSIVKFNSLATLDGARLTAVFPRVPALFLYRHPLEVMVSALESPPVWLKLQNDLEGAARRLSLPAEALASLSQEDFCGLALKKIFEAALAQDHWLFVNYRDLSPKTLPALTAQLGIADENPPVGALEAVFRQDAKSIDGEAFSADAARKQKQASPAVRAACEKHLEAAYQDLETRRLSLPNPHIKNPSHGPNPSSR